VTRWIGSQNNRLTAQESPERFAPCDWVQLERLSKIQCSLDELSGMGEDERLGGRRSQPLDGGLVSRCLSFQFLQRLSHVRRAETVAQGIDETTDLVLSGCQPGLSLAKVVVLRAAQ
jgi:hypothetical protein